MLTFMRLLFFIFALLYYPTYAKNPAVEHIQSMIADTVGNIFSATHSLAEKNNVQNHIQQHFSTQGLSELSQLLHEGGNETLTQEHNMVPSIGALSPDSIQVLRSSTSGWIVKLPLLITYDSDYVRIQKPVIEEFEIIQHPKRSDLFLIDHIKETIHGDISMVDKKLRRAMTCPMFKHDGHQ